MLWIENPPAWPPHRLTLTPKDPDMPTTTIEQMAVARLRPSVCNARTHSKKQIRQIAGAGDLGRISGGKKSPGRTAAQLHRWDAARRIAYLMREAIKERGEPPPTDLMDQIDFLLRERRDKKEETKG